MVIRQRISFLLYLLFGITAVAVAQQVSDVRFKSKVDGSDQYYVTLLPEAFDKNKSYDLIIGLHGHGADRWQFAKDTRGECAAFRAIAARHQMIAVSPDYRARTSWMGPAAEKDLLQIIHDLKHKYQIRNLYLVGGSMGATAALTFAALQPQLVSGVVAMNGHANHLEFENFQDAIAASFGGSKKEIPEEYKKRSAEYWPERLTMPIAFTVGMKDSIVPAASVIRLAQVLTKIGGVVWLDAKETRGHETDFDTGITAMEFIVQKRKE